MTAENPAPEPTAEANSAQPTGGAADTQPEATIQITERDLQARLDKAVQQALKTREAKLAAKADEERKAQERKQLEERGQFEELRRQLEAERDSLREQGRAKDIRNALNAEALKAGIRNVDDLSLLPASDMGACADAEGNVDKDKVAALVSGLKADRPYLFGQDAPPQPGAKGAPTAGSAMPSGDTVIEWNAEALNKAHNAHLAKMKAGPTVGQETLLRHLLAAKN